AIVAMYILGTAALLVALPAETVSITNGIPQAAAAIAARLQAPVLMPVAALVAILLVMGNGGGGVARRLGPHPIRRRTRRRAAGGVRSRPPALAVAVRGVARAGGRRDPV